MPDSMIFYKSFYEAIKELTPKQQAEIYNAIFSYGLEEKEIKLSGISATVFKLIKPQIDANTKRRENGKKGGRPLNEKPKETDGFKNRKPNHNQTITEAKPNVNDNVNVNVNVNDNDNDNATTTITDTDVNEIVDCWGQTYSPLSQLSPTRFEAVMMLLKVFTVDDVKKAIKESKQSSFLQSKTWFTFDWLMKQDNITKVIDGNYRNRSKSVTRTSTGTDYDALARELIG